MALLDLILSVSAGVLLLLLGGLLLRDHSASRPARLGAAFAVGVALFAASLAPWPAAQDGWRRLATAASDGDSLLFWLFARALFDDEFRLRPWHGAAWGGLTAAALACAVWLAPRGSAAAQPLDFALSSVNLGLAGLAVAQTLSSWSADLVPPRRRLRVATVAASAGYIVLVALSDLGRPRGTPPEALRLAEAAGLAAIAFALAWSVLRIGGSESLFSPARQPRMPAAAATPLDPADRRMLARLERAMTEGRLYRRAGLTIGELAAACGAREHRLRRLINQGLGHRNFNAFLNGYRIADARQGLADPAQARVSVLTIAVDAGFNALTAFNRAFKVETGMTPTAYREKALAEAAGAPPASGKPGRIQKSA
jgi:AraC-like DNA-binding protein